MTEAEHPVEEPDREFDIAVSFAGENRKYVQDVVEGVKADGFKVFYDDDHIAEMWGHDGIEYLVNVYMNRARYVLMFVSHQYADKMWTRLERRTAMSRALTERREYVLPVRLDDTELEGLLPTTFYLDANRYGLERIVELVKDKLEGNPPARNASNLLDDRVPRTQEAIDAMIAERPDHWEYRLYAGLLRLNIDALASKRRDHEMGYAAPTGQRVGAANIVEFTDAARAEGMQIAYNFMAVLDPDVQDAAFGEPGVPGEPDRIVHMAQRFVSVFENFLDFSSRLRGAAVTSEHARAALHALANTSNINLETMSRFVDEFVAECDSMVERTKSGEQIVLEMKLNIVAEEHLLEEFRVERDRAARGE